jgi:hypothetical protein
VTGAGAVVGIVLMEWTLGLIGAAAWTQSWAVVRRGHFRIVAWAALALGVLVVAANQVATSSVAEPGPQRAAAAALAIGAGAYLLVQYSRTDVPGVVVGVLAAAAGIIAVMLTGALIPEWPAVLAAAELLSGAALLGAVTNGMLLGHWYLNQPGLQVWALARLTVLTLAAVVASVFLGAVAAGRLAGASTEGAVLGIPGFGRSFGVVFFFVWLALLLFTAGIAWAARRCVQIRSIQSATGLYYVALLTAGVSEFLIRYLMVNAT